MPVWTFLLLSQRSVLSVWLSPGCTGPCLSTDWYTNLSQRSPLWWAVQTLRKSQSIKVKKKKKKKKKENTLVSTIAMLCISVQRIWAVITLLWNERYREHLRPHRRQFAHPRSGNFDTTWERCFSQRWARTPDCLLSPQGLNLQPGAETAPTGAL